MNTVPFTVTRNGPASTNHRRSRFGVTRNAAVPCSRARRAPSASTERRRPRAPGMSSNVLPSLKITVTPARPDLDRYPPSSSSPPSIRDDQRRLQAPAQTRAGGGPRQPGARARHTPRPLPSTVSGGERTAALPRGGDASSERAGTLVELRSRVRLDRVAPELGERGQRRRVFGIVGRPELTRSRRRSFRRPASPGSASIQRDKRPEACAMARLTVEIEMSMVAAISSTVIASIRRSTNASRSRGDRRSRRA